jgi:hypothetical protein
MTLLGPTEMLRLKRLREGECDASERSGIGLERLAGKDLEDADA